MSTYAELHSHLYGCISPEILFNIGKNNPKPRWEIFTSDYTKAYGKKIDPENFFTEYSDIKKFRSLYLFSEPGNFLGFQAKFNLIIALVEFTPKEIKQLAKDIYTQQIEENVSYAEYRFMNSPGANRDLYLQRIRAACVGFAEAEAQMSSASQARLAVSLHRGGNYEEVYTWLKEFQEEDATIAKYLVAIDFCHIEENHPPLAKKEFFEKVNKDNAAVPDKALAILYHVGESYTDKTIKSAMRWVLEAAEYGAHRLGHCLSVGIEPEEHLGKRKKETVAERIAQLTFELKYYDLIHSFGTTQAELSIINELESLKNKELTDLVPFAMNENYIVELNTFRRFAADFLRKKKVCVECCPTSNMLIGGIKDLEWHPLRFFVENEIPVVIGSDDPGIFNTNLAKEFAMAEKIGLTQEQLAKLREDAFLYTSEKLSGRIAIEDEDNK
ncbi:MAG: adenosine deaminase [Spirochaetota bacterium]